MKVVSKEEKGDSSLGWRLQLSFRVLNYSQRDYYGV